MRIICSSLLLLASAITWADQDKSLDPTASAIFAGGCFWCMEPPFDKADGVISTISGYSGGHTQNPTYKEVSAGNSGHLEVLKVTYNPTKISFNDLLNIYWKNVDLLDGGGQFCDRGHQYTSAIFYGSKEEHQAAQNSLLALVDSERFDKPIQTQLLPEAVFYPAENYHQDYYLRNPVRYKYYRWNCGRDQRLSELWGTPKDQ